MRFAVLLSVCVSLATTSLSDGGEISQVHDPPALKIGATDLDAILLKTRSLIDAANGPEDSGCEMVKFSIDGHNVEVPHCESSLYGQIPYASTIPAEFGTHGAVRRGQILRPMSLRRLG